MYPTPMAAEGGKITGRERQNSLTKVVRLSERVHDGRTGLTLYPHPAFVEWLMGFPAGWVTDLCPELSPAGTSDPTAGLPSGPSGTP